MVAGLSYVACSSPHNDERARDQSPPDSARAVRIALGEAARIDTVKRRVTTFGRADSVVTVGLSPTGKGWVDVESRQ